MLERNAVIAKLQSECAQRLRSAPQRIHGGDLRTDMDVEADEPEPRPVAALPVDGPSLLQRHAELVDLQACGDIRMAPRFDVGIDAQRDTGLTALCDSRRGDPIEFACRFRIDRGDTKSYGTRDLGTRLADPREDDIRRGVSCAQCDLDLAAGVRVDAAAHGSKQPRNGQRRIGFERVMDAVRIRREGIVYRAVRVANRTCAVDVDGCVDALNDRFDAYAVAHEASVGVRERLVHERSHVIMRALMAHRAVVRVTPEMPLARA